MSTASAQRREARRQAEAQAVAVVEHFLEKTAPDLVAEHSEAGLSKKDCEVLVQRIQDALQPGHWKVARQHLRSRLKELGAATKGQVYLPPPATYIRRDKSPLAGDAMALVAELEVLIECFRADIREKLNAPIHPAPVEKKESEEESKKKKKKEKTEKQKEAERKRAERQKAKREHNHRLRTLGRIVFSAIVNGGLLNQGLYRKLLPKLCNDVQACDELAWVTFPLEDPDPDEEAAENQPSIEFDVPVRRWFLDPVTLGLVTRWYAAQSVEERSSVVASTRVQNALGHYLTYLRTLPPAKKELRRTSIINPSALFRAATARTSLYLPPVLVNFLRFTTSGQSMNERSWWRYQFDRIVEAPDSTPESIDSTAGLAVAESTENRYRGDKAAFFSLQENLLRVLHRCLGVPGNRKEADKNGPAAARIEAVLAKRGRDMATLLYAFYSWILWKIRQRSRNKGRIRCSSARRYTSRLGKALIALGAELSFEGMDSSSWESFYDEVIESLDSELDRTKAVGNLRDFHRFLMICFDVPPAAINGEFDATARTRSALVSERDYERLMQALEGDKQPGHQAQVLRIIAMLMFRVGLRPNELIGLEYRHIQGAPRNRLQQGTAEPILYLHATSSDVLKTPSGVRQIPLSWFLEPWEMQEFQKFLYARISVFRDSNLKSAVILTPSQGVNTRISSKEYFGALAELLQEITGAPAIVAYTLRHSCLSLIFQEIMKPWDTPQHPFFRNGLLPREAIYALSTLAGHLDPDITLQSYVHTQDLVCHLHFRTLLQDMKVAEWAALENRKEASLHQRRSRKTKVFGEDSEADPFDQPLDTSIQLIKQLKLSIPKGECASERPLPVFQIEEPSLLDLDLETIYALLSSLRRNHSHETRAGLFSLPVQQIKDFPKICLRLAKYRTKSTSGTHNFRNLKPLVARTRLPDLYRRAQPGEYGPALPHHSREELLEANRIYRLLGNRARELDLDRAQVTENIIKPIRDLLLAHSGSEAVVRTINAEQFASAIQTIRSLNISPVRIEIEVEALPRSGHPAPKDWIPQLVQVAKTWKLRVNERSHDVTRRSQKYPEFGIVKIRILALQSAEVDQLKRGSKLNVSDRAGAGWRVGCFYAIAAISALLWPD